MPHKGTVLVVIFQLLSLILSYRVLPAGVSWILHCQATSSLITRAHAAICNFLLDNPCPVRTRGPLCGTEQEEKIRIWSCHYGFLNISLAHIQLCFYICTAFQGNLHSFSEATIYVCYKNTCFIIYIYYDSLPWKNQNMFYTWKSNGQFGVFFFPPPKKCGKEIFHPNILRTQKVWAAPGAAQRCWVLGNRVPFASGRDKCNLLFSDTNATGLGRRLSRAGVPF